MQHTSSPDKQQEEPEVGKVLTSPLIITKLSYPNITAHDSTKKTSAIPSHSALSQLSGCYWEALKKDRRTRNTATITLSKKGNIN